jgi:hypothetical protein
MKFYSINIHGLEGRANKLSLRHMVELERLDVLMIQESMGGCDPLIFDLVKIFPHVGERGGTYNATNRQFYR